MTEIHWSAQSAYPLLATLQLLPLLTAYVVRFISEKRVMWVGMTFAVIELMVAADLFNKFDPQQNQLQFAEQLQLLPSLNYHAAVDGVSVLFLLLASVLGVMVVLYSQARRLESPSRLLSTIMLTQSSLMALLVTQNLLWFVVVSVLQMLPLTYMLSNWATSPEKDFAVSRFVQFMGTGLMLLAAGVMILGWNHAQSMGFWSFELADLIQVKVGDGMSSAVFFLLFYGLAIRVPLFPFHGWLPVLAEHGTVAISAVFVLGAKIGLYGMLHFLFPLMSDAVLQWHPYVVAFAATGVFYAALLALLQNNLRRLLAYAVVSHTSIVVIGMFSLNEMAYKGSVMLAINFGLAIATLLFMSGLVYNRTKTLLLTKLGGLFDHIPVIGIAFFIAGLSIMGMPGTPGFDSVHLVLEASMDRFGALVTIAVALGNVVAAGFLLWAFQSAFMSSPPEDGRSVEIARSNLIELVLAGLTLLVLLATGFFSEPLLSVMEHSFVGLEQLYGGHK